MKCHLRLLVLALGTILSSCESSTTKVKDNDNEIQKLAEDYQSAFKRQDSKAAASYWAKDAIYTNPTTGVSVEGRTALEEEFKSWFQQGKVDKLDIILKEITYPEPGQATEKGYFRLSFKDGTPTVENAFSAVLVKEGNQWLYKKVRQIPLESLPSNYEYLKGLEWLVGDWIDKDKDVDIETETHWDMNRNFLIQKFTMKVYDQKVQEVQQMITWDPIQKNIRSWIFDSDGGFGEGKWHQHGDKWFVRTAFTLTRGIKASAVLIYQKTSDDSYTWTAEARDINGEILPDVGPINIVRKS